MKGTIVGEGAELTFHPSEQNEENEKVHRNLAYPIDDQKGGFINPGENYQYEEPQFLKDGEEEKQIEDENKEQEEEQYNQEPENNPEAGFNEPVNLKVFYVEDK